MINAVICVRLYFVICLDTSFISYRFSFYIKYTWHLQNVHRTVLCYYGDLQMHMTKSIFKPIG